MHAPLDHFTRGCELAELARYADALSEFEKAEDTYECRWNMAQTLLCLGRYADGFRFNAIRFRLLPRLLTHDAYAVRDEVRAWQGESLMGRHIVLLHEQGLGDGVLLFRYVAELRERGAKVSLLLPDELKRIGSWLAPLYSGGADYCAAMFDVPMFLATTPRSVPDSNITVPEELMEKWRQRLPEGAVGVA